MVPDDRLIAARRGQAARVGEVVLGVDSPGSNVIKLFSVYLYHRWHNTCQNLRKYTTSSVNYAKSLKTL